ncbi:MAG: SUMF1/EgtB/PvdO family nonheme iron enzyme, partial [Verrucomicrobia bacterium]|nr:SUMF1/EgtB/PvdO family nonheme iron enzyme [Verrucomicrobiota bacterium]
MMVLPEQLKIMKFGMNVLILAVSLAALSAAAQVPGIITHQGKVTVVGTNYTGAGLFKFALVNAAGATTYWSNDGSSSGGTEPAAAVSLAVARGVFSVNLGDTTVANMTQTIPASAFSTGAVYLRVWFNDGVSGSQLLTPDRRITSVAYALQATTAASADAVAATAITGTLGLGQLPGAVVTNNASGLTLGGTFTGNGAGLTGLPFSALPAVPLTNNQSGVTLGGFTTVSNLSVTATNFVNTLIVTNPPVLNGSAITNLNASQLAAGTVALGRLPTAVVTNNASGLTLSGTLSGTFTGDGAGLTNLPAATTAAAPPGMALIPAGSFTMGNSVAADTDITDAATTNVTVSAFYMDVNLVSWSQWQSVYYWATNHGYGFVNAGAGKAANHPVQTVDWYGCVKWCNARSQQAGRTPVYYTDAGLTAIYTNGAVTVYANWTVAGYRLPTEAEWEKAARGGASGQRFPWGNVINQNLANYYGATSSYSYDLGPNGYNAIGSVGGTSPATSPVGSFAANGYGLNDMAGNVFEWCWDWYGTPYGQPTTNNPTGPAGPLNYRVLRGGVWDFSADYARCASRTISGAAPSYAS